MKYFSEKLAIEPKLVISPGNRCILFGYNLYILIGSNWLPLFTLLLILPPISTSNCVYQPKIDPNKKIYNNCLLLRKMSVTDAWSVFFLAERLTTKKFFDHSATHSIFKFLGSRFLVQNFGHKVKIGYKSFLEKWKLWLEKMKFFSKKFGINQDLKEEGACSVALKEETTTIKPTI